MDLTWPIVAILAAVFGAVCLVQGAAEHAEAVEAKKERDLAVHGRDRAARAYAARVLLAAAYDLGRQADATLARRNGGNGVPEHFVTIADTQREVANWLERDRVPMLTRQPIEPAGGRR